MLKNLVNILSIALIYCGAVFGAGFATGREIFSFFSCYKIWGIAAAFFSAFLFSFFGYHICRISKNKNFLNIEEYLLTIFPKSIAKTFSFVASAFLVMSFCIMITGTGTLFFEQFGVSSVFSSVMSLVLCYIVIKKRVTGLERFNLIATPIMLIGVIILSLMCLKLPKTTPLESDEVAMPLLSGILYVSYNMVSAVAVLISASKIAQNERQAALGGMWGGVMVGIVLLLLSVVLAHHWEVAAYQMPFFALVHNNFPHISVLCSVVLYLAMMTTAVSSGVSLLDNISAAKSGKYTFFLCVLAFFISFLPFSELVLSVYSTFGLMGIALIIGITVKILIKQEK